MLRYVYIGEELINDKLIKEGFATAVRYPPDTKYEELFLASQKVAQETKQGLWSGACACKQEVISSICSACNSRTITSQKYDCSTSQEITTDGACSSLCPAPKPVTEQKVTPQASSPTQTQKVVTVSNASTSEDYSCNCKKTCAQMSSCKEAQYQLNTCGCSARDGDDDGVACDSDCQ